MLSIALPMHGVGHANYYLDLAQKDYYTAQGNDPGAWFGRGAAKLGLRGEVDSRPYERLLLGRSPDGRRDLVQNAGDPWRQTAWDLTFSAPKSVSVLWALAPDSIREKIEAAHQKAVEDALTFLEQTTGLTRRGPGGKRMERADLVFALFPHFSSRALDPQIHTHALLINLAVRQDGTTGALWSKEFFRAKMAAGAVYQVGFAAGLREGLGLVTERARIGFQVAGMPQEVCREFSQRGEAIRVILNERGDHDARTAKRVTLDTRPGKRNVRREELTASWHSRAQAMGFEASRVAGFLHQCRATACSQQELEQRFHEEAGRLTSRERTPGRLRGLAAAVAVDMGANAQQFRPLLRFTHSAYSERPQAQSQTTAATRAEVGPRQTDRMRPESAEATPDTAASRATERPAPGANTADSKATQSKQAGATQAEGDRPPDSRTNAAESSSKSKTREAGSSGPTRNAGSSASAAAEATQASGAKREQQAGPTTADSTAKQESPPAGAPPSRQTRDKARQRREQQDRAGSAGGGSGNQQRQRKRPKGHRRAQPRTKSRVERNSECLRRLDPRLAKTEAERKQLFFAWKEAMASGKAQELFEHARSAIPRQQAARNRRFVRAFDDRVYPIPAAAQTRQRLTFHAVKLAVKHQADPHRLYDTLRDMRPAAERGRISVQWQRLFPDAPKWSPARYWKAPRVVLGRAKPRPAQWGEIRWRGTVGQLEVRLQKKMLFPNAPKWSPARNWSLTALRVLPNLASSSESVRAEHSRKTKTKDKDKSNSQSH